ncbi:hypothetical protein [Variovorax ginsengisoli]|uniref:hypothetical protein n=1 Tax=Variovorax ginsengisoli TaxID=363844 RepID=UPI003F5101CF
MTDKTLFDPYALGSLTLSNRFVMAPLKRNRAGAGLVPSEFAATYGTGAPLTALNPATLYGGGAAGYIDYPTLADSNAQ